MSVLDILKPHLKEFEGLRLEAYLCPAGVPTIGAGAFKGSTCLWATWGVLAMWGPA